MALTDIDPRWVRELALGCMEGWIDGPTDPGDSGTQYRVRTEQHADTTTALVLPKLVADDEAAQGRKAALLSLAGHYSTLTADIRADFTAVVEGTRSEAFKAAFVQTVHTMIEVLDPTAGTPMIVRVETVDREPLGRYAITVNVTALKKN